MDVDETKDVNNGGDNSEETTDSSSETKTEQAVPYDRFKQVNDQKRELEERIQDLEKKDSTGSLTPEQQKELQAKTYLKSLLSETLEEQKKSQEAAEKAEQRKFEQDVDDQIVANPEVKRAEFVKFLEKEGDDYSSVSAAMKGFRRLNETAKEAAEKTKENFERKPKMQTSQGAGGGAFSEPPAEDKDKSFWEIARDAMKSPNK